MSYRAMIRQMLFGLLVLLGLLVLVVPPQAAAQEGEHCLLAEAYYVEPPANREQRLRLLKLTCDLDHSDTMNGTILVLDRRPTQIDVANWQDDVTGQDEIWFYDYRDDGLSEIAIDFQFQGEALVARLYEGAFDLDWLNPSYPERMIAGRSPSVTVTAPDGWWRDGDRLNLNLDIEVDGAIVAVFLSMEDLVARGITHDEQPDYRIRVRDTDGDGLPDYDWRTVLFPFDDVIRPDMALTALMVNAEDNERPIQSPLPWPLLGGITYGYNTSSPGRTGQPPIQVNWETGRIEYIGEFVSSRGNENQWFVYSHYPLVTDEINVLNFEAPFGFYDLAADDDRLPELAVRYLYYAPYDEYFRGGLLGRPVSIVRYSWDQSNDGFWDYKLGLAANHALETTVTLPQDDLMLQMLPYDDMPGWIVEHPWNIVTFVAADTADLRGEGLYEWDIPPQMLTTYFSGTTDVPLPLTEDDRLDLQRLRYYPIDDDDSMLIEPGLRGEYLFASNAPVRLYISGVDRKLHLYQAEGSTWNVDGSTEIWAEDRSADGYLDTWTQRQGGTERGQLVNTGHYLIFVEEDRVQVRFAEVDPALLDTSPPASHEEWQRLGARLDEAQLGSVATSVSHLFQQFSGATWWLNDATLYDARFTPDGGYRFVLDVKEDFVTSASTPHAEALYMTRPFSGAIWRYDVAPALPPRTAGAGWLMPNAAPANTLDTLTIHEPGTYIVEFLDAEISVMPYAPASLRLEDARIGSADTPLVALQPVPVSVTLTNAGLADAHGATVTFYASKGQQEYIIETITLEALAGDSMQVSTLWTPPESGRWTLHVTATHDGTRTDVLTGTTIGNTDYDITTALSLSGAVPTNGLLVLGLAGSLMVFAASLFLRVLRAIRDETRDVHDARETRSLRLQWGIILPLLLYVGLSYLYLIVRFNGLFIETDTANQTRVIYSASQSNSVLEADWPYSNGYLYTAISVFLLDITGIPLQMLQIVVYPLITTGLVLIAVATYRIYVRSHALAALAALLLFLQPDFLFVTWRGTHERFTWAMLLLLMFVIGKLFLQRHDVKNLSRYLLLFYAFAFAFSSANTFFASSYIVGLLLAFTGGYVLVLLRRYWRNREERVNLQMQQLLYLAFSALILLYIFVFFLYDPALEGLKAVKHLLDKLAMVLMGAEEAFNPYESIAGTNWVGGGLYLLLTSFTWAVLLSAVGVWFLQLRDFLTRKHLSTSYGPRLFLWLAFGAYCAQMIVAIIADRSDALTGNMQVRVFTVVVLFAIPTAVSGLANALRKGLDYLSQRKRLQLLAAALAAVAVSGASLTAVWKASIEPLVGNKFLFTSIAENEAGDWLIDHIASGTRAWTGLDERVMVSMYFQHVASLDYDTGPFRLMPEPLEGTQYFMFSDVERLRWERMGRPRLYLNDKNQVYDNGTVQIYHRRPETIFQR